MSDLASDHESESSEASYATPPSPGPSASAMVALRIPEIVREILAQLGSKKRATLAAAARVNRVWSAQALDLLWQHPPGDAFVDIDVDLFKRRRGVARQAAHAAAVSARRQFYANRVRRLTVSRALDVFRPLAFPQLREARLHVVWNHHRDGTRREALAPFVRSPRLERLHTEVDAGVAALLAEARPRLRALHIMGVAAELGPDDDDTRFNAWTGKDRPDMPLPAQRSIFAYLAEECALTLESLRLQGVDKALVNELVVGFLATHEKLAELKTVYYTFRPTELQLVAERVLSRQQPFRALKSLDIEIWAAAIPALVRVLNGAVVERLTFDIMPGEGSTIGPAEDFSEHGSASGSDATDAPTEPVAEANSPAGAADAYGDAGNESDDTDYDRRVGRGLRAISASLPNLRMLQLSFFDDTVLLKPYILSLRALTNLEEFSVCFAGLYPNGEVSDVTIDLDTLGFVELLQPLRKLRRLKLSVAADVCPDLLLAVGLMCPYLEELQLPDADYDLEILANVEEKHTPLFESLRKLQVESFDADRLDRDRVLYEDGEDDEFYMLPIRHASILAKHAPELTEVTESKGTTSFSKLLRLCFMRRVAPRKVVWATTEDESSMWFDERDEDSSFAE